MSTQPRQSISNIFGGGEEITESNLKRQQKTASDIFNQTPTKAPATPNTGKRLYQGQRDNDIFGIRERTTGETTEVKEALLQASTSTVNNPMR